MTIVESKARRQGGQAPSAPKPASVPLSWSAGVGLAALAVYLLLAPAYGSEGDGNELTLALAFLGVPHPSGYPLYTLLGGFFCRGLHSLGVTWWYAANAWSAVGAAMAVFLLHALAARLVPDVPRLGRLSRFAIALVPAGLLAFHPAWLEEATLAEVNSWHVAWLAGALLLFQSLLRRTCDAEPGATPPGKAQAAAWGLVCGLGLAHHLTSLWFVAPLSLALVWALARARQWRWAFLGAALGGAALPLTAYLFVIYRAFHPAVFQWPLLEPSLGSVWAHLRGGPFGVLLGHFAPAPRQQRQLEGWIYPYLAVALPLLIWSGWQVKLRIRLFFSATALAAVLQAVFVLNYGAIDPEPYFLPLLVVALLAVPAPLGALAERLARPALLLLPALAVPALLAMPGIRSTNARAVRLEYVERRVRIAWRAVPFEKGVVLWQNDMMPRLRAYQLFSGESPGLYVENPNMLTWGPPREAMRKRLGIDPLAGLALHDAQDVARIPENIERQSALPVVDFDRLLWSTLEQAGPPPEAMAR